MRRYYYEDARWPWRADAIVRRFLGQRKKPIPRLRPSPRLRSGQAGSARNDKQRSYAPRASGRRALDLGMGYGRNALWLARRGFQVEGWESDRCYLREAKREWRRLQREARAGAEHLFRTEGVLGKLICRLGDFGRARFRGTYDVIVISNALHQVSRSAGLRVLRRAGTALAPGGRLFLLAKLTRDPNFQRLRQDPKWKPMSGERNTFWRAGWRSAGSSHPRPGLPPTRSQELAIPARLKPCPHKGGAGRGPDEWVLSGLTRRELKRALRGLRVLHYREVVLQSDWEEPFGCAPFGLAQGKQGRPVPACPELVERVTHTVAEVVAEKTKIEKPFDYAQGRRNSKSG